MNASTARGLGIADGDRVEIRFPIGATYGRAVPAHGIRPDTLVIPGQFDHWAVPGSQDLGMPSLNTVAPMSLGTHRRHTGSAPTSCASAIRQTRARSTVQ